MFKKFRKKPIEILAFQFTKQMHEDLILRGYKPDENPIEVKIENIPDAETSWNWHIRQLYIQTSEAQEMKVNISDWIVKEQINGVHKYYAIENDIFVQTYDALFSYYA